MRSLDVLVPGTALLVPGVAGRADPAAGARADVLRRLRAALMPAVSGRRPDADDEVTAPFVSVAIAAGASSGGSHPVPDLGAVGIAEHWLGWTFHGNDQVATGRADVGTSVALLALGAAGWSGPVEVRRCDGAPWPAGASSDIFVTLTVAP